MWDLSSYGYCMTIVLWFYFPLSYHLPKCQLSLPLPSTITISSFDIHVYTAELKGAPCTPRLRVTMNNLIGPWDGHRRWESWALGWCQSFSLQTSPRLSSETSIFPFFTSTDAALRLIPDCTVWLRHRSDAYSVETNFMALHVASEANVTRHNRWLWRGLANIQRPGLEI